MTRKPERAGNGNGVHWPSLHNGEPIIAWRVDGQWVNEQTARAAQLAGWLVLPYTEAARDNWLTTHCRVAIVGSRDYPRLEDVARFVALLPDNAVVISGGARGVDTAAEQAARARGLEVVVFPADWNTHGKQAGYLRNKDIVNACDWLAAFHYNASRGTAHSIELARKAGKHVIAYAGDNTDNG